MEAPRRGGGPGAAWLGLWRALPALLASALFALWLAVKHR
jgi:hypothetical protein